MPLFMFLRMKSVKWVLLGMAIVFIGLPIFSSFVSHLIINAKVESGSYLDVVEMKEVSKLAVQRLNFSKVMTSQKPQTGPLEKAEVYIRRIMRGHVTTSLDFSKIIVISNIPGKIIVEFPELVTESFIDEWIYYDSKGTGDNDPREMTKTMDKQFREAMRQEALKPERVVRAKEQAEYIVQMLYPDIKFESRWSQKPDTGTQSTIAEPSHE